MVSGMTFGDIFFIKNKKNEIIDLKANVKFDQNNRRDTVGLN